LPAFAATRMAKSCSRIWVRWSIAAPS
jgi:hypothetical protein